MKWKNVGLAIFGGFIAVIGTNHANNLLESKSLTGSEFVWLTVTYLAMALLVTVLPKVTELTFSSVTLKIEAAERVAEVTLKELHHALELSFAPALASLKDYPGGWASDGPLDDRIPKFLQFTETLKEAGLTSRFAAELSDAARAIAIGQLHVIARYNDEFTLNNPPPESLPTPATVRIEACNPAGITKAAARYKTDEREALSLANRAVDAYAEMYSYAS